MEIDPISVEVGKIYFVSATVTATSTGTFKNADWGIGEPNIDPANQSSFDLLNEQDAYENGVETNVSGTVIPNQSTIGIVFRVGGTNSGNNTLTVSNISVKEVTFDQSDGTLTLFEHPNNVPRVEWDADRNRLGLLVEESRTNLFTESEKLSEKDHSLNTTDNAIIAPDRTQTASFCKPTTASAEHFIDDANVTAGTDYAMSCFAKQGPGDYLLAFRGSGIGANPPRFNLATGTIDNEGASSAWSDTKIEDVGNGWYRCSSIGNPSSTTPLRFQIVRSDGAHSFAGDGTSGLYIWGCQIEQASFPTSYIKTTGSTATRSADVASIPVADFGYNTAAGSFVAAEYTPIKINDDKELFLKYLQIVQTMQSQILQTFDGTHWVVRSENS